MSNNNVAYVGLDVHKNTNTCVVYNPATDTCEQAVKLGPDRVDILRYLSTVRAHLGPEVELECGYEAGCLGYELFRFLQGNGVNCTILAPSTMAASPVSKRRKNDSRDAETIAKCLAFGAYSPVYVPTPADEAIRDYIRMREDLQHSQKKIKQQILAFCLRKGFRWNGKSNWTLAHLDWARKLELNEIDRETLDEYLLEYDRLKEKLSRLDKRIEEFASKEKYAEKVGKLQCFLGLKAYGALALIVETGDFSRFETAGQYASSLGLTPSESSSGDKQSRGSITKAGNSHLRRILTEASNAAYAKGRPGYKSAQLEKRQEGQAPEDIAYADRANERLRRRYQKMVRNGKPANVAKTACARELSCFVWGVRSEGAA